MSALTEGFMTAPDDTIWSSGVDQGLSVMDVSALLSMILLKDTATLGQIAVGEGKPASNIEIRWLEDSLNAVEVTAAHTYASDAGDALSITVPITLAAVKQILRAGTVLNPINTDYYYQVDATPTGSDPSGTTITAYNSKGKGSSVTSTQWRVVAMPFTEGADASDDISKARILRKNYTQILERTIKITKTRRNVDMYAVRDEVKHQTKMRMFEIKRELNQSVLTGQGNATVGDSLVRTMKGVRQQIEDLGNTDTYKNAGGADFTEDTLNTLVKSMFDLGGLDETSKALLIVPSIQQEKISQFNEDIIRTKQSDKQSGAHITQIQTRLGIILDVVLDRWMPADSVSIVDASRANLRHLQGDQFFLEQLAKTGRTETWELSGQYSLELRNAGEAHSWMYGNKIT